MGELSAQLAPIVARLNAMRKGAITESDVLLAAASEAIIIGFQGSPDSRARELAATENVDIRSYDIIYEAENDVKKLSAGSSGVTASDIAPTVMT